ncbi:MAG: hypothetical protein P8183_22515 [Anaerolineae bacterium]
MSAEMKPEHELDDALLALREEYEQTTPPLDLPSEPKEGQELKTGRFPKIVSYLLGVVGNGRFPTYPDISHNRVGHARLIPIGYAEQKDSCRQHDNGQCTE